MPLQESVGIHDEVFKTQLGLMPLSGVTERYGIEGLYKRFSLEIADFAVEDQYFCNRALYVVSVLHRDDPYKGLPYTSHLIRTAIRLIRDYEVTDPEVISAMLLHDSVEDHAKELAEFAPTVDLDKTTVTERALAAVAMSFSGRVAGLVQNVTNAPNSQTLSQEQKNLAYALGVAEKIAKSPETFLMKLSDFTDNAVGILWSEQTGKVRKLATKYLPVFDVFLSQLSIYEQSGQLTLSQITTAQQQLYLGKQRCFALAA